LSSWVDRRLSAAASLIGVTILGALSPMVEWAPVAYAQTGIADAPCPPDSIPLNPDQSIQDAVDRAAEGAAFCLKNGIHRMQAIRPRNGQAFYGEGHTILNGSRQLTSFTREGRFWVANEQEHAWPKQGVCADSSPACNVPEGLFIDDKPLTPTLSKEGVRAGQFFFDQEHGRLYFADDPADRKVEATAADSAFQSAASNVTIKNLVIEKYASAPQTGAVQGREGANWTVEDSEVRLNSGAGIGVGEGAIVRRSTIHHNGQLGIGGVGRNIKIENNWIWANNTRGFDFTWEAGGAKLALSVGATFRGNYVHDNIGPGLWCDIDCRDAIFESNIVESNHDAGIFYEISSNAIIRDNVVKHNGIGRRGWFWGADILVAASQNVEVRDNTLTVSPTGCGIILIDQSRQKPNGEKYKTRDNIVRGNKMIFEGSACAGGVSDARRGDENFDIITQGANVFDANAYQASRTSRVPARFVWGHAVFDWDGVRGAGMEQNGRLSYN
jgi:parallel beta-helix repeat protein